MAVVLHITNRPTPYRLPLYREIRATLKGGGDDLHVLFLGEWKRDRNWNINEDDLEGLDYVYRTGSGARSIKDIIEVIDTLTPAVVVLAWAMDLIALRLLLHCRRRSIPCLVVSGETERMASTNSYRMLRGSFRRIFFKLASGFLSYGLRSAEYLRGQGVEADRVTTGINAVDTRFFQENVDRLRSDGTAATERERYTMSDTTPFDCHLLFVGYLLPVKGCMETLEALRSLQPSRIALHIVGSGAQMHDLRLRAFEWGLEEHVFFHDYRQTAELPLYYAFADVVLFPSLEEIFGLVMVEGAAAGLPVIASANAGGTIDAVEDGVNGLVVDPCNVQEYAAAIGRLASNPLLRASMGEKSRERAVTYLSLSRSAECYLAAVRKVAALSGADSNHVPLDHRR